MKRTLTISVLCNKLYNSWLLVCLMFVMTVTNVSAQTFQLPDTNFRNKLISSYPSLMTGNKLNIAAATAYPGALFINNSNISDLSGIEYFGKIFVLDASQNQLVSVPGISMLKQLNTLWLRNNKLTSIPTLTAVSNLYDLEINGNQLTNLPDVSGLSNLTNIYAASNLFKSLPDLSSLINLKILHVSQNQLDSLPDLSALTKLTQLHCDNNNLKQIKGLQAMGNLQIIYCWNNYITDLSGLSANTALGVFYCYSNRLTTLPTLNNKPSLNSVNFSSNQFTFSDLSSLQVPSTIISNWVYAPEDSVGVVSQTNINENQSLTLIAPVDNGVPGNKYYWYKDGMLLDSNQLGTFIKTNMALADSGSYSVLIKNPNFPLLSLNSRPWKVHTFYGYDSIGNNSILSLREKDVLTLTSPFISTVSGASYKWYKNGSLILVNQTGKFFLPQIAVKDSGLYRVEIIWPAFTKLKLTSGAWKVVVVPCMDLYSYKLNITQSDCSEGVGAEFTQVSVGGHNLPYSYALLRSDRSDTAWSNSLVFNGNLPGKYTFFIKDSKNCQVSGKVQLPNTEGCENIFSPNGNTNRTSYYIEEQGKAQIVDIKGNVVSELLTPGYWDGTRSDQSLADTGYYAIIVNNKKVGTVTLVR